MSNVEDLLKNQEKLLQLLARVKTSDLVEALAVRENVFSRCESGVRILMIAKQS